MSLIWVSTFTSFLVLVGEHDGEDQVVALRTVVIIDFPENLVPVVLEGAEVVLFPGIVVLVEILEVPYLGHDLGNFVGGKGSDSPGHHQEIGGKDARHTSPEPIVLLGSHESTSLLGEYEKSSPP